MPDLNEIIKDLEECKNYESHDIHTAFRYLEDLRKDILGLALHLKQLRGEFDYNVPRDSNRTT